MIAEQTRNDLKALTDTRLGIRRKRSGASHFREPGIDGGRPIPEGISSPKSCQWLDGEPRDRKFCGADVEGPGRVYCAEHAARAYRKPSVDTSGLSRGERVLAMAESHPHLTYTQIAKAVNCHASYVSAVCLANGMVRRPSQKGAGA